MSLLVASVVYIAKMDVRQVQFASEKAQAKAILDGAVLKSMVNFQMAKKQGEYQGRGIFYSEQVVAGQNVTVRLVPVSGLIALTSATKALWIELFVVAAEMEPAEAELLADNILDWQKPVDQNDRGIDNKYQSLGLPVPRHSGLLAIEDLLAVAGMTGEIYRSIKDYVYLAGSMGVDPVSAPEGVLRILAGGNQSVVDEYVQARNESLVAEVFPHAQMKQEFISNGNGSLLRVDARMQVGSGKVFQRRTWVETAKQVYGLPWAIQKIEVIAVVKNLEFSGYSMQANLSGR